MKKLILSVVVAAFAFAVQAGDEACAAKAAAAEPACCAAKQASNEVKGTCSASAQQAKADAKAKKGTKIAAKQLKSPKASS